MTRKNLYIAVSAFLLPVVFSGCMKDDILTEPDYNVTLDPSNTYVAGEPVTFNFSGSADNIIFYSGETGSEYQYRDRYSIPIENVTDASLNLSILPQYGSYAGGLDVYYTNSFTGLDRSDAEADKATLTSMYQNMEEAGWTQLSIWSDENRETSGTAANVTIPLGQMKENFSIAFHWHPTSGEDRKSPQRTYRVNGSLSVQTDDYGTLETDLKEFLFTTVMMNEELSDSVYVNSYGNGSIRFDDSSYDIIFQGVNAGVKEYDLDGWCVSVPMDMNSIQNDKAVVVKNMQNYLSSTYSHIYNEPGTYKAVFVGRNSNYLGTNEKVKELTITILAPSI